MFKEKKILVLGKTGLLGSGLMRKLKQRGYKNLLAPDHSTLDLTNQSLVNTYFSAHRPQTVFLAAGEVGGILANKERPADFWQINTSIQSNTFMAAHQYDIETFIYYGSSCAYPKVCPQPMKETSILQGDIESTSSGYASAKISGLLGCQAYNNQIGLNRFIALVPNSIYGPGDHFDSPSAHVLGSLIHKIHVAKETANPSLTLWGTGTPRREFVFVEDAVDASIFAMENKNKVNFENRPYNVGSGTDCSIKELASHISEIVGFRGELFWDSTMPNGAPQKLLDSNDFRGLGWQPTVSLSDGLEQTYKWYLDQVVPRLS
jgi:GDP-L-fucose synthase